MTLLDDHQRFKKRFIPPLLANGINFRFAHWVRGTVPEILWIGVLIDTLGPRDGVESAVAIAAEAQNYVGDGACVPPFSFARAFLAVTDAEAQGIQDNVQAVDHGSRGLTAMEPLFRVYPDYPLAKLSGAGSPSEPTLDDLALIAKLMDQLLDRTSPKATLVQATAVTIGAATSRLRWVVGGPEPPDLDQLAYYPSTDESRAVASEVRAVVQTLIGLAELPDNPTPPLTWPREFWERGLAIGECE